MAPRVSAMLRRQAEEETFIAQDRERHATKALVTIEGWLRHGIESGFCGEPVCIQHDGTPFTADEADQFEAGDDPCMPMIRVFPHA